MAKRIVFLNALPLNAFPIDEGEEVSFSVAKEPYISIRGLIKDHAGTGIPVECYIRVRLFICLYMILYELSLVHLWFSRSVGFHPSLRERLGETLGSPTYSLGHGYRCS